MTSTTRPRLFLLLHRAHHAVRGWVGAGTRDRLDLTVTELTALWAIRSQPGLGVQDLARALHVDHAVVSRLSRQLERKAVVRTAPDPADGRRRCFHLTDDGRRRAELGLGLLAEANARLTEGFDDAELAVVVRFLHHLVSLQETP